MILFIVKDKDETYIVDFCTINDDNNEGTKYLKKLDIDLDNVHIIRDYPNAMYFNGPIGLTAFYQRTEANSSGSFQSNLYTTNQPSTAKGVGAR